AFLRGTSCFSAALRFQQQRSEIMNRVSHFVNNFFHYIVATAGLNFQVSCALQTPAHRQPCFPLPRRVSVSAKEA
ncbi:hypothetical protein, partial [Burkholderia lata]|uniref:hypothetical protein n=1 Tax=Burkholderia lata (strain ATCC 17760 / DSM 23089 / LMG 22485 / NCIMB 9086 / R18194 / 383) TaxID=482957 RepID=UPI00242E51E5